MELVKKDAMQKYKTVSGKVVLGENQGRLLGFSTANIEVFSNAVPSAGIYAVIAEIGREKLKAVANLGYAPTFNRKKLILEVHIFDFFKDIYKNEMKVHFVKKLRSERKFANSNRLVKQIKKDCEEAKRVLKAEKL